MHSEQVQIYSDQTNAAVMQHPGRKFPGVLIQGDTLSTLCRQADRACDEARQHLKLEEYKELNDLRNRLWGFLTHYETVLREHGIRLPYGRV
jgi:hypothetical protein